MEAVRQPADRRRAGPEPALLPGLGRAVVGDAADRRGALSRTGRHHDLQGTLQRLPVAGQPVRAAAIPARRSWSPSPTPAAALAFVTNSLRDVATGKTILSVCVLTGVFPPPGSRSSSPRMRSPSSTGRSTRPCRRSSRGGSRRRRRSTSPRASRRTHAGGPIVDAAREADRPGRAERAVQRRDSLTAA